MSAVQMSANQVLLFYQPSFGESRSHQMRSENLLSLVVTLTSTRGTLVLALISLTSKAPQECGGVSQTDREPRLFQELAMMSAMIACSRQSLLENLQHFVARDLLFKFIWVTVKLAQPAMPPLSQARLTKSSCPGFNNSFHIAMLFLKNLLLCRHRRNKASPPLHPPVKLQLRQPRRLHPQHHKPRPLHLQHHKPHPLHLQRHPSP